RARPATWGAAAMLMPVAAFAVAVYASLGGAVHSDFDPLSDEVFRRVCATEIGLGAAAVVLGIVAVVRRSGRGARGIDVLLGVLITVVSLVLFSWTEQWHSEAAPSRYEGWTRPAHATFALVQGSGGFLFSHGTVFVCTGPARRIYFCR